MLVRGYEERDREACRDLWRELTQWHRDIYDDQTIWQDRDPGEFFDEHLEHVGADRIWVAELDDAVVGFAGLIVTGTTCELEPVVVATGARAHGVGRELVERVVAAARGAGLRRIDVRPAARNVNAIRFFHDVGFEALGHLELMIHLQKPKDWPVQERIADRDFRA